MRAAKVQTQVRQEQIAEAALRLVVNHGLKGLGVARVARQVGVVPSAIYRHYSSKDEVLDAVLDLIQERLLANVRAVCERCTDALERLHRLLLLHVRLLRENQGIPRAVFSQELHNGQPRRKARMYEIIREYLGQVAGVVRQGQETGQVRADFTPEAIARMFLGIVQPAALLWSLSDGTFDVTKHAELAWQVLDAAIRPVGRAKAAVSPKRKEN